MFQWSIPFLCRLCFCFTIGIIGINGESVSWSSWSDCSVTCGQGSQTRTKICLLGPGLCLSNLLGTQKQDCNSGACPTYTPTTYSPSPTTSPAPSITTSKPAAVVIDNSFFTLNHRGCRYSNVRISRTVKVRSQFHCTSICARDSKCVAFNLDDIEPSDSSRVNKYLKCEILETDYGSSISLSQVSENCKNYERATI